MDPFFFDFEFWVSCWVVHSFFCISLFFKYCLERTWYIFASSVWLTSLSVWLFKVHPCGSQCQNFLILVLVFHGCVTVHHIYVPQLVSPFICQNFCWFFFLAIETSAVVLIWVHVPFIDNFFLDINSAVGMSISRLSLPWEIFPDIQRLLTSWSLTFLERFPPVLATGHFLRAAVINGTQATWIEVPVSSGDHVVIKENVIKEN